MFWNSLAPLKNGFPQYLLYQRFGTLILNVAFGWRKQSAYSIHVDAALNESSTSSSQFVQAVVIGCIHHPWNAQYCTPNISNFPRTYPVKFEVATWHTLYECTRSVGGKRRVRTLQWSAFGVVATAAVEYMKKKTRFLRWKEVELVTCILDWA